MNARERVEALLAAANRVFGRGRDPALVHALAVESGLHVAGVTFALDRSLELAPDPRDVSTMLARASENANGVLVVLAANVFVAPLRAIAWALASSPRVLVRPSRRARTFVDALLDAAPELAIERVHPSDDPARDLASALPAGGVAHVYGGADTVKAVRRLGVAAELHGPGFGAVVGTQEELVRHAREIAEDVALFDQRGCLSPRIVFAVGRSTPVAEALHDALSRLALRIPRGELTREEAAEVTRARDVGILSGRALEASDHLVLEIDEPTLAPAARVLPVVSVAKLDQALAWLLQRSELACIGANALATQLAIPGVRSARIGAMQRPPLDGPVDLRVVTTS